MRNRDSEPDRPEKALRPVGSTGKWATKILVTLRVTELKLERLRKVDSELSVKSTLRDLSTNFSPTVSDSVTKMTTGLVALPPSVSRYQYSLFGRALVSERSSL
jgi:hypothetical protein